MRIVSDLFISIATTYAEVNLMGCIKKCSMPSIQKHNKIEDAVFWHNMSRVHYEQAIWQVLESNSPKLKKDRKSSRGTSYQRTLG